VYVHRYNVSSYRKTPAGSITMNRGATLVTPPLLVQTEKELAAHKMTPEEAQRRQDAMAKNNALLFYQEQKAKRIKKIKSKAYHRQLKKQAERARARLGDGDLDDPDTALVRSAAGQACAQAGVHCDLSGCLQHAGYRGWGHVSSSMV
jgi:Utp14 protein